MKRLIIVGSPRASGRSAHLAEMLFEANIDEHPEDELFLVPISEVEVGPCIGCDACREKSNVILKDEGGKDVTVQRNRCVFDDDMQALYDLIDDADQLTVVSPVYFSGAPAPLKCLLDRLQPYFWANTLLRKKGAADVGGYDGNGSGSGNKGSEADEVGDDYGKGNGNDNGEGGDGQVYREKRPAELHVIGEGGDPHGYDALVSEVRSALAVAGFRLDRILDWVGKIDEAGEIVAEATETLMKEGGAGEGDVAPTASASVPPAGNLDFRSNKKRRPKLDLSSGARKPAKGQPGKKKGSKRGAK